MNSRITGKSETVTENIFREFYGTLQSSKCDVSGEYDFITADSYWKKHSEYPHNKGAIIYAVGASGS